MSRPECTYSEETAFLHKKKRAYTNLKSWSNWKIHMLFKHGCCLKILKTGYRFYTDITLQPWNKLLVWTFIAVSVILFFSE